MPKTSQEVIKSIAVTPSPEGLNNLKGYMTKHGIEAKATAIRHILENRIGGTPSGGRATKAKPGRDARPSPKGGKRT